MDLDSSLIHPLLIMDDDRSLFSIVLAHGKSSVVVKGESLSHIAALLDAGVVPFEQHDGAQIWINKAHVIYVMPYHAPDYSFP